MDEIKKLLKDQALYLLQAIFKGLRIFVVYIIPSAIAAMLVDPQFRKILEQYPYVSAVMPVLNILFVMIADIIKKNLPADNTLQKVL